MPSRVLIDNWTLQNAGELLHRGLSGELTSEMEFSADGQSFHYRDTSQDAVALECLCQLVHHVVFADELLVDGDFVESWTEFDDLAVLARQGILRPKPFKQIEEQWQLRREAMVDLLCLCPEVRQRHVENVASFAATQKSADAMLAQVVWGGAGMLARADHFRTPYEPHPLRERLFVTAQVFSPARALRHVTSFIEEEALKLYERSDQAGVFGQYALPPAFVQVLDNAASFSELLPAALHVRKSYADLRHWTGKLQDVLDQEDVGAVLAQRKVLQSVAKNLSKLTTLDPVGDTSVQFGASWAKVTTKLGSPLNWASNRFGVRAQIKRLVLTPQGRGRFRKLLRFLGEDGTARGIDLERAWVLRQGAAASG